MKKIIFPLALVFSFLSTNCQDRVPLQIGHSYRIHPGNVSQTETFIAKSPADQNTFFVGCNTITFVPFFISEGNYVTNDGGNTWRGSDTCNGDPAAFHGGDPGITINKDGRFILTRLGRTPFVGLYSHYSDDQGRTWSPQQIVSNDDLERATLVSDARASSPGYGKTYAVWIKFAHPFPLMFAWTGNGAASWSTPVPVNNPVSRSAGGDLAIGPDGTLYACWAGVTDVSPFRETYAGFAWSSDAGNSWHVTENIFPMYGITGVLPDKNNIRVNGLPSIAIDTSHGPRRGWIYIVSGQKNLAPAGNDPDIILRRSTDGGQTWSSGIRVNQDALNNGKEQFFPAIHVDAAGGVNIIFYDDRNTTSDSAGVFLSRSVDGGETWAEYEISDHHFKPAPIGGLGQGYQGDNIDLSSTETSLIPVWMDNSSGIYQIWTNPVKFSDINGIIEKGKDLFSLRISPNPFSVSTMVSYHLNVPGEVKLEILDAAGRVLHLLVHENQGAGDHSVIFSADGIAPGIYFCRIRINAGGTQVIKFEVN